MQTLVASHHCLTDDVSWYFNYLLFILYQTFSTLTFKKKKKKKIGNTNLSLIKFYLISKTNII